MVLYTQIKGKNLIETTITTIKNHSEKIKKKGSGREPQKSKQEVFIMKIRTGNDIKEFNAALEKCKHPVWLMGPNDEIYNMKNEEEYIEGILRLTEGDGDQLGIFTASYEDEMTMTDFFLKMAA